tara:strand:- start:1298 stop:2077 length:780 start_codon:yes stop_codon:yes gene_type:complete
MSITTTGNGRLCNQVIRNLALSLVAKKFDLYVTYANYNKINNILGIELYIGKNKYNTTRIDEWDKNDGEKYLELLNSTKTIDYNLDFMKDYLQVEKITDVLYKHLRSEEQKKIIIEKNPFKDRYNKNNDLFIHIRLGDLTIERMKYLIQPIEYYLYCIETIPHDKLYIGSDSLNYELIKKIQKKHPNVLLVNLNDIETIQFGSTCKNVVLSTGSYSAVIGYISFFSNIYYLNKDPIRCPLGLMTNKSWNVIEETSFVCH